MQILMTTDTLGGVWQYSLELAEALCDTGVKTTLAAMGTPPTEKQRAAVARIPNVTLVESSYKLEWMDDPWADLQAAGEWLLALEHSIAPDIVHLNCFAHAALPWQAPRLVVGHSCVCSWYAAVRGEEPPPSWNRYRDAVAKGLRCADAVTAPTQAMLDCLLRHYGPFKAARRIFNGRKSRIYQPGRKEPFILTAGRLWDEAKNIHALERVAPHLNWPVYAAGEARSPNGGHASFRFLNLLGNLDEDELAEWMSRASIYALPARYEPFGLSALEAALSGCALVLSDIPSLRELWTDAAVFVPPDNEEALAAALDCVIVDERLRRLLADKARIRALKYKTDRMANAYETLYQELIRHREYAFKKSGCSSVTACSKANDRSQASHYRHHK